MGESEEKILTLEQLAVAVQEMINQLSKGFPYQPGQTVFHVNAGEIEESSRRTKKVVGKMWFTQLLVVTVDEEVFQRTFEEMRCFVKDKGKGKMIAEYDVKRHEIKT